MTLRPLWISVALLLSACGQAGLPGVSNVLGAGMTALGTTPIAEQVRKNALKATEFGLLSRALPEPGKAVPLTYLTYEALDNNLEGDIARILNKLEGLGSSDQLNLLAHTDANGDKDTRRYYLMRLPETKEGISSPYVDLPELNSAAPRTLEATVRWGFTHYPSRARWFNFSSHGCAWRGALADDTSETFMSLPDLAGAVRRGLAGAKLDLVSFDACLMSSLEVAFEFHDVAGTLVASEDSTLYWGRGYYDTMVKVAKRPDMAARAIATDMVQTVHDTHQGREKQTLTISALDLAKAEPAAAAVNRFADVLLRKVGPYRERLKQAVRDLRPFTYNSKEDNRGLDVYDMGALLTAFSTAGDAELRQAAGTCREALFAKDGFLLATRNNHRERGATSGFSIYVPVRGFDHRYRNTAFARETRWDEFLIELNR